jgi:hypothetical protein
MTGRPFSGHPLQPLSVGALPGSWAQSQGVVRNRPQGVVRWSATFPDRLNPGADWVLLAREALRSAPHVPELHVACERPHRTREEPDS